MQVSFGNSNNVNNYNNNNNNKPNIKNELLAAGAAIGVETAFELLPLPINTRLLKKMREQSEVLTQAEKNQLTKTFNNAYQNSGIADKIKVKYVKPNDVFTAGNKQAEANIKMLKEGTNAFLDITNKQMLLPENHLHLSRFHELGHAIINQEKGFMNAMQKVKVPIQLYGLAGIPGLFALLTRNTKPDENGKLTTGQKTVNFLRKIAPAFTMLMFTPMVIEEAAATKKGEKLAKKVLPENLFKKAQNANRFGFATYAICALASSVGTYLAINVLDKIREKA